MNLHGNRLSVLLYWCFGLLGLVGAVLVVSSTGCSNSSTLTPVTSNDAGTAELDAVPETDSGTEIDSRSELKSEAPPARELPKYSYGIVEQLARSSSRQTVAEFESTLASLNRSMITRFTP